MAWRWPGRTTAWPGRWRTCFLLGKLNAITGPPFGCLSNWLRTSPMLVWKASCPTTIRWMELHIAACIWPMPSTIRTPLAICGTQRFGISRPRSAVTRTAHGTGRNWPRSA